MSSDPPPSGWRFVRFGLLVTGKGEQDFFPLVLRSLTDVGDAPCSCAFEVIRRVPQLSPVSSSRRQARMVGKGQLIPSLDEEIGLAARHYLFKLPDSFVILVDDLEHDRAGNIEAIFQRYRTALDTMLIDQKWRASAHFLVNMLEAYYFADAKAINEVLGTALQDWEADVEAIRHPKNDLRKLFEGFDEKDHGRLIVQRLDLRHVLSTPDRCASLRTLVGWCTRAMGKPPTDEYQLLKGVYLATTRPQIDLLPPPES